MSELKIRKDTDEGIVEVDTGDGWRGLGPDAARSMAEGYEESIESGDQPDNPETRRFIDLLRDYAGDVEGR